MQAGPCILAPEPLSCVTLQLWGFLESLPHGWAILRSPRVPECKHLGREWKMPLGNNGASCSWGSWVLLLGYCPILHLTPSHFQAQRPAGDTGAGSSEGSAVQHQAWQPGQIPSVCRGRSQLRPPFAKAQGTHFLLLLLLLQHSFGRAQAAVCPVSGSQEL